MSGGTEAGTGWIEGAGRSAVPGGALGDWMAAQWAEEAGGRKNSVCKQSFFKSNPISSEPWEAGSVKILCLSAHCKHLRRLCLCMEVSPGSTR